jgi:hypothetical protein
LLICAPPFARPRYPKTGSGGIAAAMRPCLLNAPAIGFHPPKPVCKHEAEKRPGVPIKIMCQNKNLQRDDAWPHVIVLRARRGQNPQLAVERLSWKINPAD